MANSIHHSHNYLFWYKSKPSAYFTTYVPVIDVRHNQQIDARTKEFKPKSKPIANASKEFKSKINVNAKEFKPSVKATSHRSEDLKLKLKANAMEFIPRFKFSGSADTEELRARGLLMKFRNLEQVLLTSSVGTNNDLAKTATSIFRLDTYLNNSINRLHV